MASAEITPVLDRILEPVGRCLNAEAAAKLVQLRADPAFQATLDDLADKNTAGVLSAAEQAQYDLYLAALSVLTVLQTQARVLLRGGGVGRPELDTE